MQAPRRPASPATPTVSPAISMATRNVKECIEHWRHSGQSQAREVYDGFSRGVQYSFKAKMIQRGNRLRLYAAWQCSSVQISVRRPDEVRRNFPSVAHTLQG